MRDLYGSVRSRAFRVRWMLEELGLDYAYHPEPPRSRTVVALNRSGRVPVLVEDGAVMTDSVAIMTFLADRAGRFTHPAGTVDRARQDALTFRVIDDMDAILWTAAKHSFVLPEDWRQPEIKETLKLEFDRNARALAEELTGDYLTGDSPVIPDFLLAHCWEWAGLAHMPRHAPAFDALSARMRARPAFARAEAE
ncbi:glutathione S-transferase family protein [Histidinibacterium lentulum]|uniref:Glutathione S-transferase n=1 Tax=Histidinibacterium lentulum TaxID=2480588 RepID=A0A3N2R6D6_9RHOB|nr:glutathione S-transferase [Histidinibacterium lentulum]ROU02967.1 glutathione S-transferase [Histidinibacterium lentulum]